MQPETTTLAYLAGVIDSDGYVTAARSIHKGRLYYGAGVGIAGTDRQPHDLAASIFGGNVRRYLPKGDRSHHKPQFQWQRYGESARPVLEAVLPYLLVKRVRATLALELQDLLIESRLPDEADPFPWAPAGWDPESSLDVLVSEIRERQCRTRVGKKAAGRLLDGRTWDDYPAVHTAQPAVTG